MTKLKTIVHWFQSRFLLRRSLDSRYALAEACVIGLVSALSALLLKQGIGWLGLYRLQAVERFGAIWVLPIAGLASGYLAGLLVEQLSPAAAGGGIPQVKAVLAQFSIPLSVRVALVKMIGTVLVLGAGLTLGRRGPTVHIGAALAAQLSRLFPNSPEHRRQLIAAGAAAGLAAGFNTPLAGILFVVEELMRDISSLTLETAILASFTGAVVSRWLGSGELNIPQTILDGSIPNTITPSEVPFYLVLGILAGVLGAFFNRGILLSLNFNRHLTLPMPLRIGLAGLISGVIVALLPPFFQNNAGIREFLVTSETGDWQTTAEVFVAQFFLTLLAYGSGAPGGVFAPALVLGTALGYLCGNAEVAILGIGYPQTYALVGMGAFFTAVARVPVTAIVIVFEITADFRLVLPLMVCSAVAYLVGEAVFRGSLYQHLLEHNGIELEDETSNNSLLERLTASEVMQRRVETLGVDTSLEEALKAFSRSSYQGFPVLEDNKLVGIVTQTDLSKLAKRKEDKSLRELMTPKPITVSINTPLCDVLYLLDRYKLSHLPVTEGSKLIGIITRGDIIRVEAERLQGSQSFAGNKRVDTKPEPSYVIYQTRSPAVGKGRILLPLSNPQTAPALIEMAVAIANQQRYELECLVIISVPRHNFPAQTKVNSNPSHRLLTQAQNIAEEWQIPIHTQIRVARNIPLAIIETINERQIDLVLMGWKGHNSTPGHILSTVADRIMQLAPCDLLLAKLGQDLKVRNRQFPPRLKRTLLNRSPALLSDSGSPGLSSIYSSCWLVLVAGGPHSQRAIHLLENLTTGIPAPQIWLCQIYSPQEPEPDLLSLQRAAHSLNHHLNAQVMAISICAPSLVQGVVDWVQDNKCDVVVLGATQKGILQQNVLGSIPERIAKAVGATVILVREALD